MDVQDLFTNSFWQSGTLCTIKNQEGQNTMKVYEAETLKSAMIQRSNEYKSLREQFVSLKNAFKGVADLDDDFQGEGADAIKAFYRDLSGTVDGWLDLTDMQIQFLEWVSAALETAGLSGDTIVDTQFLGQELMNVYTRSKNMVSAQKEELQSILVNIDDLISLEPFSSDEFDQQLNAAEQKRKDAIKAVEDLDKLLKNEYAASEMVQQMIKADYSALIDATGQGTSSSPIRYNANAYQSSKAYQLKKEVHLRAKSYVTNKKAEAPAKPDSEDEE
ncbi:MULTISPECIES: ribonuclease YeeF family protein [unclassified Bacillus (in: firmicutes)]|uniref:ribonuclease YeeF family protein n=1 Tax=unclassified Bacillus (in: firmicutes) TaxID=185979 RepID=UPI001F19A456|nr:MULTISPECIES: LXG domain-containing protein [unclassified Bacillus (in: firmicutes)]WFA05688.1 LXG domain-containing protein [Bacillus sp. HSf4]